VSRLDKYKVDLPEGESGEWRVERFTVSDDDSKRTRLYAAMHGRGYVPPGTYTQLRRGRTLVMSDTPDEIHDHLDPIFRASGLVRIHGLGLGMVAAAVLEKPDVERVTVVELSTDVISLVAPTLRDRYGDRLEVIQGDAMKIPGSSPARYSVVWHDIWDNLTHDNLPEMATLHRKWGRHADWQGSWGRGWLETHRGR